LRNKVLEIIDEEENDDETRKISARQIGGRRTSMDIPFPDRATPSPYILADMMDSRDTAQGTPDLSLSVHSRQKDTPDNQWL